MLRSCTNCRRRRRACDRARPSCSTCRAQGIQCEGYQNEINKLFVNLNVGNFQARKKRVLGEAISEAREQQQPVQDFANLSVRTASINCCDMKFADFENHYATLWAYFQQTHSKTQDAWASSLTPLRMKNKSLDLALVAIGSLRLAQGNRDSRLLTQSFTAYSHSLRIFRRLCQGSNENRGAMFAAISLVLGLFEAMQCTPEAVVQGIRGGFLRQNPHISGCLLFVRARGPEGFQRGGYHLVFKKIRELSIMADFGRCTASFLAQPTWMSVPWKFTRKTHRDKLFDLAAQLTVASAAAWGRHPMETAGSLQHMASLVEEIGKGLEDWYRDWLSSLSPAQLQLLQSIETDPTTFERHTHVPGAPDVMFLAAEHWCLRLVKALVGFEVAKQGREARRALDAHYYRLEAQHFASLVDRGLHLEVYGLYNYTKVGIVEGQCRSILASWAVLRHEDLERQIYTGLHRCSSSALHRFTLSPPTSWTNIDIEAVKQTASE